MNDNEKNILALREYLLGNNCTTLPLFDMVREKLEVAAAGQVHHHNFDGGLVRHILEMIRFGIGYAQKIRTFPVAGNDGATLLINPAEFINVCLLHDLAKLEFYVRGDGWEYVKHDYVLQEMVVQNMCAKAGVVLTENEMNALWMAEGGYSPLFGKVKQTPLSILLHMADLFSSQLLKPRMEVVETACPRCGEGKVVERRGPTGLFYGCSKFPDCKYTSNAGPGRVMVENTYEW